MPVRVSGGLAAQFKVLIHISVISSVPTDCGSTAALYLRGFLYPFFKVVLSGFLALIGFHYLDDT